jgi:predicted PP-loop superfamily ATPase
MTWKTHIDWTVNKALQTFCQIYPLLKSEKLDTSTKLTLYKILIRSKMTYACPTWESAANSHLMKPQRLQNRILRVVRFVAFPVTEYDEVLSGYQPGQMVER